ncbi:hypothetical protein JCM17823_12870 [Halorubrum gandharaense]
MTSLSEVYGGRGRQETDLRRLYLGVSLFAAGTLLLVAGILAAGTEMLTARGYTLGDARLYGGVLGGLGVPTLLLGVMTVLPADRNTRAAALVGAAVMGLGVAMFAHAYPGQWIGGTVTHADSMDLTLPTAGLYFLGAATTFWCLFVGIANFKTRNDPGGTVTMEVTHKGETKIIEVDRGQLGSMGGVGLLGGTPDGDVETQTNRPGTAGADNSESSGKSGHSRGSSGSSGSGGAGGALTSGPGGTQQVSDGGSAAERITSPIDGDAGSDGSGAGGATVLTDSQSASAGDAEPSASPRDGPGDTYCGNCAKFDYARTDEGMQPYCRKHEEVMDDMDACDAWTPR